MGMLKDHLIAQYNMNDDAATAVVVDETGNYNGEYQKRGVAQNTDTGASAGKINGALAFVSAERESVKILPVEWTNTSSQDFADEICNQGVARDTSGNFYTFSHSITVGGTSYRSVITKFNSSWEQQDQWTSVNGIFAGDGKVWYLGDGTVINGKLYIALRAVDYSETAIGIWTLDLVFESIHSIEGGMAEEINERDGSYWIIQGSRGSKARTIAEYNTSWVRQNEYNLSHGYDGFAWIGTQIFCTGERTPIGSILDIYDFNGSSFRLKESGIFLGKEGFYTDGTIFYAAGDDDSSVQIGTIVFPSHSDFIPALTPFSVSVWVKMSDAAGFEIVNKGTAGIDGGYYFRVASTGYIYAQMIDETNNARIGRKKTAAITSYEDKWLHLVLTYDGGTTAASIKIYMDGERADDADDNLGSDFETVQDLTGSLYIGGRQGVASAGGLFDNVTFFDKELTLNDARALWNGGAGRETIPSGIQLSRTGQRFSSAQF